MTATGSAMLRPEDLEPAARRTMRALRTHQRGGPERLVYEDAPVPHVGVGDALVRVHAAAITPAELTWEGTWRERGWTGQVGTAAPRSRPTRSRAWSPPWGTALPAFRLARRCTG